MINTPATLFLETLLPPQGGRTSHAADAATAPDFAELINRFLASTFSVAVLPPAAEIPAAAPAPTDRDRIEPERQETTADRPQQEAPETPPEGAEAAVTASDGPTDRQPPAPTETNVPSAAQPAEAETPAPRLPLQATQQPGPASPVTPTPQGAERQPAQAAQQIQAQETDPLPPQARQPQTTQPVQQAVNGLRAQSVPGDGPSQLPQFGHTLSGSSAVTAQAEAVNAAQPKAAGTLAKAGPADQAAASLLGNAAQSSPNAAQRGKSQAKLGNAAGKGQGAQGTQAAQAPGQTVPQAATATVAPQTGFNNTLAAAAAGTGQPAVTAPGARSEPLPFAGSGGQPSAQGTFRGIEQAAASKPRTPVPPRFVANQVAVQIQKSIGQGNDRINIQLRPAELGKVEVRLDVGSDGRVSAVITADRADTLDLLQRDARILQNSLQDAGLRADSNSLSFELKGNGQTFAEAQHGGSGKNDDDPSGADGAIMPDTGSMTARPGIVTNDRVDIHV